MTEECDADRTVQGTASGPASYIGELGMLLADTPLIKLRSREKAAEKASQVCLSGMAPPQCPCQGA